MPQNRRDHNTYTNILPTPVASVSAESDNPVSFKFYLREIMVTER
jgi:hypothetical protein